MTVATTFIFLWAVITTVPGSWWFKLPAPLWRFFSRQFSLWRSAMGSFTALLYLWRSTRRTSFVWIFFGSSPVMWTRSLFISWGRMSVRALSTTTFTVWIWVWFVANVVYFLLGQNSHGLNWRCFDVCCQYHRTRNTNSLINASLVICPTNCNRQLRGFWRTG